MLIALRQYRNSHYRHATPPTTARSLNICLSLASQTVLIERNGTTE
jgi:hypothetical protein